MTQGSGPRAQAPGLRPRVIGIDPGTVSLDICGLDDGRLFLDRSLPTAEALGDTAGLLDLLTAAAPIDLVAGPSGYGLPLLDVHSVTDEDLRLACLAPEGEAGGIGGLRALMRALARLPSTVLLTPGVIHLPSVPSHRKVNRVDMGTADKVCAVVLAIDEQIVRRRCAVDDVSLVLLEAGGAFSAVVGVDAGRIVDGAGGTSGPMGVRAAGALDGEVAFLAGAVTKDALFQGGASFMAGATGDDWARGSASPPDRRAWDAYVESAAKAVAAMLIAVPRPAEIVLSGRHATPRLRDALMASCSRLTGAAEWRVLDGFARISKHAAQGAALMADGLAGGRCAAIVERLGLRQASGTVLDHLTFVSPEAARRRLGLL